MLFDLTRLCTNKHIQTIYVAQNIGKGLRHSYEYGQRSAAQHDEGGSRATRLVGYVWENKSQMERNQAAYK